MEQCPLRRSPDNAAELGSDDIEHEVELAAERREDDYLLRVGIQGLREWRLRPFAARDRGDRRVRRVDLGRSTEPGEQLRKVVLPAQDGVLIRRPQRHVASPGLTARQVDVGAV